MNQDQDSVNEPSTTVPNPRPSQVRPIPWSGSRLGVRHIMLLVLASALAFWVVSRIGWWLAPVLVFATLISGAIALVAILIRRGAEQRETMLWVVAKAAEKQLPIGPAMEAFGELCGGTYRWRALAMAKQLDSGQSFANTIDRVPGALPAAARIYARMEWPSELLARALNRLAEVRAARQPFRRALIVRVVYLGWVFFALQSIAGFSMYWIMPKLEAIFIDFGVNLPTVSERMISISNHLVAYWVLPLLLIQFLLVLALPLLLLDPMHLRIAPLDWWLLRRHGAAVLRVLSLEVRADRPLPKSLEILAQNYPSRVVRRRLRFTLNRVERGQPAWQALRASGLIRGVDAAVLEAAERAGNLSWALGDLADSLDRRSGYRLLVWLQVLFPIAILAISGFVFLFALSFFVPLITLIEQLAT